MNAKLMRLYARRNVLSQRGEVMNYNLLRKINRLIKKYESET